MRRPATRRCQTHAKVPQLPPSQRKSHRTVATGAPFRSLRVESAIASVLSHWTLWKKIGRPGEPSHREAPPNAAFAAGKLQSNPQSERVISTLEHRIKVPLPNRVSEAYSPLCRHLVTKRFDGNGPPLKHCE